MTATESAALLPTYQPPAGCFDESRDAQGAIRSSWRGVHAELESLGVQGLQERGGQIEELIRENGASFLAEPGEDATFRPWQLGVTPIAIGEADWSKLAEGVQQRVRVLESILNDLLGDQRLIRERIVPPELLWANPNFFRAYHRLAAAASVDTARAGDLDGSTSASHRLHVVACDIARGAGGSWWVTGDRTRAASGMGYLLENRIVYSRVFPHLHRQANVRRLAGFFANLREHFRDLAPRQRDNPRIALLTPGQGSYRDFEDAYLARYLGYTLVQGRDLAVRGDRLHLKTLGGLLPIEVLWRHVSDRKCDPLELMAGSNEGVTGLLRSIRAGQVSVVNALGTVLAEMPALMPFLPAAAKCLTGENMILPNVATYWCGGASERQYVIEHLDDLVIRNAYANSAKHPILPSTMSRSAKETLVAKIKANPDCYVGQARLAHSVAPVWREDRFEPWHVALRVFALQGRGEAGAASVDVLPGALARVSPNEDLLLHSPTSGLLTQDCWIISDSPVDHETTLLPGDGESIRLRRSGAELPSRVADHLLWLGRYVERCEFIARLLRTTLVRLSGEDDLAELPELPRLVAGLAAIGQLEPDYAIEELEDAMPRLEAVLPAGVFASQPDRGLHAAAARAASNAVAVRDRISLDAYRIFRNINDEFIEATRRQPSVSGAIERLNQLLTQLLAFSGLTSESLTRTHGWRFVMLGRRIERAEQTAELLSATLLRPIAEEATLCEAILDATDSLLTYRSRYLTLVRPAPTIDLLVTDESNPRSLRFQLEDIELLLRKLPTDSAQVGWGEDERIAASLAHQLRVADVARLTQVDTGGRRAELARLLDSLQEQLPKLAAAIDARYLIHTARRQTLTGDRESSQEPAPTSAGRIPPGSAAFAKQTGLPA